MIFFVNVCGRTLFITLLQSTETLYYTWLKLDNLPFYKLESELKFKNLISSCANIDCLRYGLP